MSCAASNGHTSRGFTLIELLVVISIIALLASLLFPALRSALERGKQVKCVSNVHGLLVARAIYTTDTAGNLIPARPRWPDDPNGVATWRYYLVKNYGVSPEAFLCPAAPNAYSETEIGGSFASAEGDVPSNYTHISEVYGNDSEPRRVVQIGNASRQIELVEFRDYWPDMNMGSWGWVWADGYGVFGFWHSWRTTFGYADGHVEVKMLVDSVTPVCEWDTPAGPHDGAIHPEFGAMLDHYQSRR